MEAAANANGEAKKAKIETPEVKKRKGGRSRKKDSSEDEERDEEQEDCSAKPKCLRPIGKQVKNDDFFFEKIKFCTKLKTNLIFVNNYLKQPL